MPSHAAAAASASSAVGRPSRKRQRAESDPGQPLNLARLRTRAPRPTIISPVKKARVQVTPVETSLLLDQTHARRMALLEEESKILLPID
jgi:hypothetical protein